MPNHKAANNRKATLEDAAASLSRMERHQSHLKRLLLQLLAGLPVSNNWLIGFIESLKATDEERLYLQQWVTHERASGTHIAHHYPPPDND